MCGHLHSSSDCLQPWEMWLYQEWCQFLQVRFLVTIKSCSSWFGHDQVPSSGKVNEREITLFCKFFCRDEKLPYLVNEFHDSKGFQPRAAQSYTHSKGTKPIRFEEIECVINGDSTVKGIKDGSDVFMPFSFIQKYFEVQMIQKRKMTMNCLYIYIYVSYMCMHLV